MTARIRSRFQAGFALLAFGMASATPAGATLAKGMNLALGWAGYRYGGIRLEVT